MSRLDEIAQSLRGTDVSRTADLTRMAMEEGLMELMRSFCPRSFLLERL